MAFAATTCVEAIADTEGLELAATASMQSSVVVVAVLGTTDETAAATAGPTVL